MYVYMKYVLTNGFETIRVLGSGSLVRLGSVARQDEPLNRARLGFRTQVLVGGNTLGPNSLGNKED